MPTENEPVLRVRQLSTRLCLSQGIFSVVEGVSFDLWRGKTLALVGESGCGKSMTALSIMRILPSPPALPSEGEVVYQGRNLLKISEREMRKLRGAKIAMIFQDPMTALNPVYTIGWQLLEVAALHLNLIGDEAEQLAFSVLSDVGIPSPAAIFNQYPHQLSGGMQQRVMIAMALICKPDVLIADEPTTALDVTIQAQILELMNHLQKSMGMAILLITHDMGVVAQMADEVIVMYATQAVERGEVNAIFDRMSHPYTRGLFGSLPSRQIKGERLQAIKGTVPSLAHLPHGCRFHPRCPHAMEVCRQGEVPNFTIDETGHWAKCWLFDEKIKIAREKQGEVAYEPSAS